MSKKWGKVWPKRLTRKFCRRWGLAYWTAWSPTLLSCSWQRYDTMMVVGLVPLKPGSETQT
jgi:hypothetical protein